MSGFAHLHVHSCLSFLDGTSTPEELVEAAIEQGMDALAITDTNGLYGAVRLWNAAKEHGIKPIYGTEIAFPRLGPVVLLAKDRTGWTSLCRIVSAAQLAGKKEEPRPSVAMLEADSAGLFALSASGDRASLEELRRIFGESLFIELVDGLGRDDQERCDRLVALARELGLGTTVTNDVHYARPEGRRLHDVMRCIDLGVTIDEAGDRLPPNGEWWLKGEAALRDRFASGRVDARGFDEAFANAAALAERCTVDLDFEHPDVAPLGPSAQVPKYARLPGFPVPEGHTAFSYLYELCQRGAREKYGRFTPAVSKQLAHELDVIERAKLAEFFLINWDIVRFCKDRRIPAQGRGSAADSIVAYVLDITKVDPIAHDLLFERFLSEDSKTMPDIDIDIATNDREEVIQYVYKKYGERFSAMVCNLVTYRARLASREVAKALGFRPEVIDRMSRAIDHRSVDPRVTFHDHPGNHPHSAAKPPFLTQGASPPSTPTKRGVGLEEPRPLADTIQTLAELWSETERERFPLFRELTLAIADLPRHLSIHNGGMLITAAPLVDVVPIERATMPDRNVVQLDKRDVEDLGLVKMDLLGLRTLSLVKDAVAMIDERHGAKLELGSLPLDDEAVYDLICEVDTIGLFQVESRAQAQALPRVRPRSFADIVVQVAIIRPGPLQGNAVNPYIRRRQGREPVTYASPALEPVLKETLGVILFQEQILKVAMVIAGFTPSEGDKLRRAMSRARSAEDMERLRTPFVTGAQARGVGEKTANEIFGQIAGFAEFGFCKSHAAAFALTAYHTAHLKLYYPAEFYVALLNNQPMGFYSPAVIAGDAKRHGTRILPVDINVSLAKAAVEEERAGAPAGRTLVHDLSTTIAAHRICRAHHVRLGLTYVKHVGDGEADAIVAERERGGPYRSFDDLARRVALKEEALRSLALVGAFDAFGESRRQLLWRARDAHRSSPAFARPTLALGSTAAPALPALTEAELSALDYRLTGVPTGPQVMAFYRAELDRRGILRSIDLAAVPHGRRVSVAGAIVVKQHPETAKGHVFLSLEDEVGITNVIVRPRTYKESKAVIDSSPAVIVDGICQSVDGVISVLARAVEPIGLFARLAAREWQ
jgi:error-prone DNA polymerase